jgi:hypothetical protein
MAPPRASRADITESRSLMWYVLAFFFHMRVEMHTLHCPALPGGFLCKRKRWEEGWEQRREARRVVREESLLASADVTRLRTTFSSLCIIQWAVLPDDAGSCRPRRPPKELADQGDHPMARACLLVCTCGTCRHYVHKPSMRHITLVGCTCVSCNRQGKVVLHPYSSRNPPFGTRRSNSYCHLPRCLLQYPIRRKS